MSPRRNRRSEDPPEVPEERLRRGVQAIQSHPDGDWLVRLIPGGAGGKTYRCPGCDQEIPAGVAHLVVWPAEEDTGGRIADRRHWHRACWEARDRRGPTRRRP